MEILKITDSAKNRINEIMQSAPDGTIGIRIGVAKGGCSGYKYEVDYATDKQAIEETIELDCCIVIVAPEAMMFLIGAVMDYKQDALSSGFDFTNPNETARCGCGESFLM